MKDAIRILVIDDSPDDRELYWRALNKNADVHYEISDAQDGERGLARIAEHAPDCILLDYSLPGRNGIEVLKRIHAMHPHIAVVMLTGQGNETVAVAAMREGAQNYIAKSAITPDAIAVPRAAITPSHGEMIAPGAVSTTRAPRRNLRAKKSPSDA